jgi:exodeoxyribonuclease-3
MFQEIKADAVPPELKETKYEAIIYPAKKKGYSGLMILARIKPKNIIYGIGIPEYDNEARVLSIELDEFYVVNTYFPNSQHGLARLDFKLDFDNKFSIFINKLRQKKEVIVCGDFNVAHTEIDIARPKDNINNAGFTIQERQKMTELLDMGYIDTFRMFTKDPGYYTWWTYRTNAREKNIGWRIDYFIVSKGLKSKVKSAEILNSVKGSDHAPITLDIQ